MKVCASLVGEGACPHTRSRPQSRPDLFPKEKERYFSLDRYHLNGSRILSRSFHVEKWRGEHTEEDSDEDDNDAGEDSAMDIDPQEQRAAETSGQPGQEEALPHGPGELQVEGDNDDDSDDEDREDPADVAMVPMADMLNARFESENVSRSSP